GHRLHRRRGGQQVGCLTPMGEDLRHGGGALGDGAGLVQHHRVHAVGDLQNLAGADQDTMLGPQARAYHDGGGSCQPQGTGAGDDQHRCEHPQHKGEGLPGDGPDDGGQQRDAHDHRHEHTGHFVGGLGDRGFPALGVLHEPDDAGEGGVVAGTGHLDVQHA
ncbi:HTH-type transcriptional regulator immR, partial [Dysosmobacter welbionis]